MAQHSATTLLYPIFNLPSSNGVELFVRGFSTWVHSEISQHLVHGLELNTVRTTMDIFTHSKVTQEFVDSVHNNDIHSCVCYRYAMFVLQRIWSLQVLTVFYSCSVFFSLQSLKTCMLG